MVKYKRKAFTRVPYYDISIKGANKQGKEKLAIVASNLDRMDIKEINFNVHDWITLFDGDMVKVRVKKDYSILVLIDKRTGQTMVFPDLRAAKRLHSDILKIPYKWHIKEYEKMAMGWGREDSRETLEHEVGSASANRYSSKEVYYDKKTQTWKVKR